MAMDMDEMLQKIKDRQWALADIDWDAPGAETITDEFRPKLKAFMADLCWIENVGARGFAAMAKKAPTPTIAEIYRYFHAEEQRHANAELALMKRWGMLEDGEIPEPNVNIRLAIEWLDKYSDDMPLSVLGTVIPMLEVALDGALLKFLLEEVHDPVCHQVFEKINNDESRHIAVDFEVLDMIGHAKARKLAIDFVGNVATPGLIIGALMYVPLLNRMRNNIVDMGLEPERLYAAMNRFKKLGERGEHTYGCRSTRCSSCTAAWSSTRATRTTWLANTMVWLVRALPEAAAASDPDLVQGAHPRAVRREGHGAHSQVHRHADRRGRLHRPRARPSSSARRASTTSSSSNAPTGSAAPGATPPIPARPATSLRCCTRSRSPRTRPGRAPTRQREICQHIEELVERFDLGRHIRFGAEVTGAEFDESEGVWEVDHRAAKQLPRPHRGAGLGTAARPELPGHPRASTPTEGHKILSARWDHDYDFAGKRVAVIGTGASAVQIIPGAGQGAGVVKVFQRTPGWVLPRLDVETSPTGEGGLRERAGDAATRPARAVLGHEAARPAWSGTRRDHADPGSARPTCGCP